MFNYFIFYIATELLGQPYILHVIRVKTKIYTYRTLKFVKNRLTLNFELKMKSTSFFRDKEYYWLIIFKMALNIALRVQVNKGLGKFFLSLAQLLNPSSNNGAMKSYEESECNKFVCMNKFWKKRPFKTLIKNRCLKQCNVFFSTNPDI